MISGENKLFLEWEKLRPDLVRDGVVNAEIFTNSSPKILLILKEVNDPGGGGWDLREFLLKGGLSQTWNNVTRWVIGMKNLNKDLPWGEVENITKDLRLEYLKYISVINLKKTPGGASSDINVIEKIALEDKELLNRQFELYKPTLTICCGTSGTVDKVFETIRHKEWKTTSRGIGYKLLGENQYLFSHFHPQSRIKKYFLYYGLLDAIREVYCSANKSFNRLESLVSP